MKLSLDWLSDFVAFNEKNPQKIAEVLTLGVAEVEKIEVQGALLDHCCVAKIIKLEKHSNADSLTLCDVETDKGKKRVVCGGVNLHEDMLVAFAHCGATVRWHGEEMMELKPAKIRGEKSEGMICAAEELDLQNLFPDAGGKNIIDLEKGSGLGWTVGQPLKKALGLNDIIFHIDNHGITHRADLFSHIGFARECVALGLGEWKKTSEVKASAFAKKLLPFKVHIEATDLVPRYMACSLHINSLGETPEWMKRRLIATGWRSVNLPIDITNYVLMEMGSPLHSFDADDFKGDIHIRTSKKGESVTTLDGVTRVLPKDALVINDDGGVFDLLGIMGGLRSSTKKETQNIYLQSASLDPVTIRKAIIATGHRTDGATVYEKGVPPSVVEPGLFRAIELFLELVPGAKITSQLEEYGEVIPAAPIYLPLAQASSLLGRVISTKEATQALESLDFDVQANSDVLQVTPPLHRLGDISIPVDIIEEIARVVGYASFEEQLPIADITAPLRDFRIHTMRDTLKEAGCSECVQFAFLGEDLLTRAKFNTAKLEEVENPLGEDMRYMRPSLLPRLLECAEKNIRITANDVRLFEIGHTFSDGEEENMLTLLVAAKHERGIKEQPFLVAKSIAIEMLLSINTQASFAKQKKVDAYQHPGRSVGITVLKQSTGSIFEIHPSMCSAFGLPQRAAAVTINLDVLFSLEKSERVYHNIPDYPSVEYDTTIILPTDVAVGPLLEKARSAHEFLRELSIVDVFQKGTERSVTVRSTYNAGDRTLKEEEVKPIQEKVEKMLTA